MKTYIKALVHYYALIPHEKAAEIYKLHFGREMDPAAFAISFQDELGEEAEEYDYLDDLGWDEDLIINANGMFYLDQVVFRADSPQDYLEAKMQMPWHIPELEELLRYAREDYVEENQAFLALDSWIQQHAGKRLSQPAETLAPLIANLLRGGFVVSEILRETQNYGLKFKTLSEKNTLKKLVLALEDETRMAELNGYSPRELGVIQGDSSLDYTQAEEALVAQPAQKQHEAGRNDPCPCGSGKKYKKCCGIKR